MRIRWIICGSLVARTVVPCALEETQINMFQFVGSFCGCLCVLLSNSTHFLQFSLRSRMRNDTFNNVRLGDCVLSLYACLCLYVRLYMYLMTSWAWDSNRLRCVVPYSPDNMLTTNLCFVGVCKCEQESEMWPRSRALFITAFAGCRCV